MAGPELTGSPTTGCRSESILGQRSPHKGWRARERASSGGVRSPLREAQSSNSDGADEQSKKSISKGLRPLRPYHTPYPSKARAAASASGPVSDGAAGKIITLRCMYTNQKTKKRKTWSDGAVKCCPKRQRVSLYRWSEALGVTEKLLGEIYLTVSQYEAFVTEAEPELEMEVCLNLVQQWRPPIPRNHGFPTSFISKKDMTTPQEHLLRYIASLDGVIQPDNNPSGSAPASGTGGAAAGSSTGGGSAGGPNPAGRKRKLFKAFKPPSRREPVSSAPCDSAWGAPPERLDQLSKGDRNGDRGLSSGGWEAARGGGGGEAGAWRDGRGALPPRATYTGFGHVESLWDEEEEEEEGRQQQLYRREGFPGEQSQTAEGSGGWGVATPGWGGAQNCGRDEDVFPGARPTNANLGQRGARSLSPSAEVATAGETDGWMRHDEDDGGGGDGGSLQFSHGVEGDGQPSSFPVRSDFAGHFAVQQSGTRYGQRVQGSNLRDEGVGELGATDDCPDERGAAGGVRGLEGDESYGIDGSCEHRGSASAVNDQSFETAAFSPNGEGHRDPEGAREPAVGGDDGSGGVDTGEAVQTRSTQDILSLFGGFGDGDARDAREPPQGERAATPVEASRTSKHPVGISALDSAGNVPTRAADMRRARKESRAAAVGEASQPGFAEDAPAAGQASAVPAADATGPAAGWACEVCGVRGASSSRSCRVCGAKRQTSRSDDDISVGHSGVDSTRGDASVSAVSQGHRDWDGDGAERRGGWDRYGWESAAVDEVGGGIGEAHHDGALRIDGVDGEDGVLHQGRDDVGRGDNASPSCRLSPGTGSDSGCPPRALNSHRVAGARMQMDVGSSSDSDDA